MTTQATIQIITDAEYKAEELEECIPIEGYDEEDWLKEDMMMEHMWEQEEFLWGIYYDGQFVYCHHSQCYRMVSYCPNCDNVLIIEEFGEFCPNNDCSAVCFS